MDRGGKRFLGHALVLVDLVALTFLVVYALRTTERLEVSTLACVFVVVLVALGLGAAWEIVEYAEDRIFDRGVHGSPAMPPSTTRGGT